MLQTVGPTAAQVAAHAPLLLDNITQGNLGLLLSSLDLLLRQSRLPLPSLIHELTGAITRHARVQKLLGLTMASETVFSYGKDRVIMTTLMTTYAIVMQERGVCVAACANTVTGHCHRMSRLLILTADRIRRDVCWCMVMYGGHLESLACLHARGMTQRLLPPRSHLCAPGCGVQVLVHTPHAPPATQGAVTLCYVVTLCCSFLYHATPPSRVVLHGTLTPPVRLCT